MENRKIRRNDLDRVADDKDLSYLPKQFLDMYHVDQLGGIIRNVEFWVEDIFEKLVTEK